MPEITQEQIFEYYRKLPDDMKEAMTSVETSSAIYEIGRKTGLDISNTSNLAREVGYVLLGITNIKNFVSALEKDLQVDHEKSVNIAKEVNEKIFKQVFNNLKRLHGVSADGIDFSSQVKKPVAPAAPKDFPLPRDSELKSSALKPLTIVPPSQPSKPIISQAPKPLVPPTPPPPPKPVMPPPPLIQPQPKPAPLPQPPTPPTPPKTPTIFNFAVEPNNLNRGENATLRWSISNATEVWIEPDIGLVPSTGTKTISPSHTTKYILMAKSPVGNVSQTILVNVSSPPPPPPPPTPPPQPTPKIIPPPPPKPIMPPPPLIQPQPKPAPLPPPPTPPPPTPPQVVKPHIEALVRTETQPKEPVTKPPPITIKQDLVTTPKTPQPLRIQPDTSAFSDISKSENISSANLNIIKQPPPQPPSGIMFKEDEQLLPKSGKQNDLSTENSEKQKQHIELRDLPKTEFKPSPEPNSKTDDSQPDPYRESVE